MANHFRDTAASLRQIAESKDNRLTDGEREDVRRAASTLCRLEQLKRDLIASDHEDEAESDRLSRELMALLGIHVGS